MTNGKRVGALLLCAGLILVLAVSTAFMIHEADHDCTGEDCPVCRILAINIRLMRTLGLAAAVLLPAFFLLFHASRRCAQGRSARRFSGSLVSLKIRLND